MAAPVRAAMFESLTYTRLKAEAAAPRVAR